MAHTCPFENDHDSLPLQDEVRQAIEGGFCPLCLHDFLVENPQENLRVCVECGHSFEVQGDLVKIIPLED